MTIDLTRIGGLIRVTIEAEVTYHHPDNVSVDEDTTVWIAGKVYTPNFLTLTGAPITDFDTQIAVVFPDSGGVGGTGPLSDVSSVSTTTILQTFLGKAAQRVVFQQDITGAKEIWGYGATEMVFNDGGIDLDFRWEGTAQANALFIQGSDGFVGIGNAAPTASLHLKGSGATSSTKSFLVTNSTPTNLLDIRDDGLIRIGFEAGLNDSTGGVTNLAIGYRAMKDSTTATGNLVVGNNSLKSISAAAPGGASNFNTIIGNNAVSNTTMISGSVVIGYLAGGGADTPFSTFGHVFIGNGAGSIRNSDNNNVGVGNGAFVDITGWGGQKQGNTAIGSAAMGHIRSGDFNVAIGQNAGRLNDLQSSYSVCIGAEAKPASTPMNAFICIGYDTKATASNQAVIGGDNANGFINDMILGRGVTSTTANAMLLRITGASGNDVAGNSFSIGGGAGTGNAVGGSLLFKTSLATTSGTDPQTLATRAEINAAGNLLLYGSTASEGPGKLTLAQKSASIAFSGGATEVIAIAIPANAVIVAAQLRNNTALTATIGISYSAAYSGGSTQSIGTGLAFTKNTKVMTPFNPNAVTPITSGSTNITLTPNAGTLDTGTVEATVYYYELVDMGNAA